MWLLVAASGIGRGACHWHLAFSGRAERQVSEAGFHQILSLPPHVDLSHLHDRVLDQLRYTQGEGHEHTGTRTAGLFDFLRGKYILAALKVLFCLGCFRTNFCPQPGCSPAVLYSTPAGVINDGSMLSREKASSGAYHHSRAISTQYSMSLPLGTRTALHILIF